MPIYTIDIYDADGSRLHTLGHKVYAKSANKAIGSVLHEYGQFKGFRLRATEVKVEPKAEISS